MSKLQVDDIVNKEDTGSVGFSRGAVVTGVATATSFSGPLTGNVTGTASEVIDNTQEGVSIYCEAEDNCYTSEELDKKAQSLDR